MKIPLLIAITCLSLASCGLPIDGTISYGSKGGIKIESGKPAWYVNLHKLPSLILNKGKLNVDLAPSVVEPTK